MSLQKYIKEENYKEGNDSVGRLTGRMIIRESLMGGRLKEGKLTERKVSWSKLTKGKQELFFKPAQKKVVVVFRPVPCEDLPALKQMANFIFY
jgi:hypothetical protein